VNIGATIAIVEPIAVRTTKHHVLTIKIHRLVRLFMTIGGSFLFI